MRESFLREFADFRLNSESSDPDVKDERCGEYTRCVGPGPQCYENTIYAPHLSLERLGVQNLIREQIVYFKNRNKNFEWKTYDFDSPRFVPELLKEMGFTVRRTDAVMYLPTAQKLAATDVKTVQVTDPQELAHMLKVVEAVWNRNSDWLLESLSRELKRSPTRLEVFYAEMDSQPVSVGWVRYYHNMGMFFGGSTLKEYRGRGAYRALVKVRAERAHARGIPYVLSECSPDSKRVLEAAGFHYAGQGTVYDYKFGS